MKCLVNYQRDDAAAAGEAQNLIDELAQEYGRDDVIDFAGEAFDELELTEAFDELTVLYVIIGGWPRSITVTNHSTMCSCASPRARIAT
jgi:hypothetical protein